MPWKTARYKFYNYGAIYFTDEQRTAERLIVVLNVQDYRPELSQSFLRNPAQTVLGYSTIGYRESVLAEIQQRYFGQVILNHESVARIVNREICRATNYLAGLTVSPDAAPTPFFLEEQPFAIFDSIRFRSTNQSNFEFLLWWEVRGLPDGTCTPESEDLPDAPQQPADGPPPGPPGGYEPPTEPGTQSDGTPDSDLSGIPNGAPAGDYDPANARPGQTRVRVVGQAINGQNLGCNVLVPIDDIVVLEGIIDQSRITIALEGSFDPGGCVGARLGFSVKVDGATVATLGPAGFYDAPTVASVEYS